MTSSVCVFRLFHLILASNYGIRLRQRPCCTFDATIKPKFNCEFVRYFSFRVFYGFFFYSVCMICTLFTLRQSSIYSIVYHYNAYAEKRIAERLHSFSENDCRFSQNSFNSYKLAVSVWAIRCNKSQAQFYCSFTFSNVICVYFFIFSTQTFDSNLFQTILSPYKSDEFIQWLHDWLRS